eukprot:COSAG04_NODE_5479_length_1602_cov_1.346640_2_plen_216_part_00
MTFMVLFQGDHGKTDSVSLAKWNNQTGLLIRFTGYILINETDAGVYDVSINTSKTEHANLNSDADGFEYFTFFGGDSDIFVGYEQRRWDLQPGFHRFHVLLHMRNDPIGPPASPLFPGENLDLMFSCVGCSGRWHSAVAQGYTGSTVAGGTKQLALQRCRRNPLPGEQKRCAGCVPVMVGCPAVSATALTWHCTVMLKESGGARPSHLNTGGHPE